MFDPERAQDPGLSLAHTGARGRLTMSTRATVADRMFPVYAGHGSLGLYEQPLTGFEVPHLPVSGKRRLTVPGDLRTRAGLPEHTDVLVLTQTLQDRLYVTLMTPACVAALSVLLWKHRTWPHIERADATPH